MKTCLYAGTFDPITDGHHWIISEAAELFDRVVVAVADNPAKRGATMFDIETRVQMVKEVCIGIDGVEVITYANDFAHPFTTRFASSIGATHLVRGMRNASDFMPEQSILHINQDICSHVRTLFLVPPRHLAEVSSSMVKNLVGFHGWREVVSRYVQDCVVKRFQAQKLDFSEIMLRIGASPHASLAAQEYLNKIYACQPHYHNLTHISECLELLKGCASDPFIGSIGFDEIAAALIFHDCIYDINSQSNEENSAFQFMRFAHDVDKTVANNIVKMIMVTKNHDFQENHKENIVSDIDMAILGSSLERFIDYEKAIRMEYRHVSDAEFYPRRKALLQHWLNSSVYHTKRFSNQFEHQKEVNIRWLLETDSYRSF